MKLQFICTALIVLILCGYSNGGVLAFAHQQFFYCTEFQRQFGACFRPHVITISADNAEEVYATDMDRDGDIDVLSASVGDNQLAWYENDGSQNFYRSRDFRSC